MKLNLIFFSLLAIIATDLLFNTSKKNFNKVCLNCNLVIINLTGLQAKKVFHLGYNRDTTPTIDIIAEQGVSFSNAISPSSWTFPSGISIFTGLFPSEHQLNDIDKKILTFSSYHTLAQILKDNGYLTAASTTNPNYRTDYGLNKGFDIYQEHQNNQTKELNFSDALSWLKINFRKKFFLYLQSDNIYWLNDASGKYIFDAHLPENNRFKGTISELKTLKQNSLYPINSLNENEVAFWRLVYDSKIRDADDRVAKFFEEFDKLGVSDKTIVIVLSDHGTEFYEHQRFDHGHTLYDELVHVPLVISGPNLPKGKRVDNQVRLIDVAPTIIDLLGLKTTDQYQSQIRGKSLLNLIDGKEDEPRDAFMETDYRNYTHKRGIRTADGWKYILTMDTGEKELYHLKDDPSESKNVYNDNLKLAYELDTKLKKHLQDMGTDIDGPWDKDCLPVYGEICQ
jgi:arylsulfatase A-like enzyme